VKASGDFDTRARADYRLRPGTFDSKKGWTWVPMAPDDEIRFMSRHSGYVMVRKPRCMPFVMTEKDWLKMPVFQQKRDMAPGKPPIKPMVQHDC
jgi:hypothetical protein